MRVTVTLKVTVTKVITEDHHDVGPLIGGGREHAGNQGRENNRK